MLDTLLIITLLVIASLLLCLLTLRLSINIKHLSNSVKKGRCVEAKKGHYEFAQVLAITKPSVSSGCFKKIML